MEIKEELALSKSVATEKSMLKFLEKEYVLDCEGILENNNGHGILENSSGDALIPSPVEELLQQFDTSKKKTRSCDYFTRRFCYSQHQAIWPRTSEK